MFDYQNLLSLLWYIYGFCICSKNDHTCLLFAYLDTLNHDRPNRLLINKHLHTDGSNIFNNSIKALIPEVEEKKKIFMLYCSNKLVTNINVQKLCALCIFSPKHCSAVCFLHHQSTCVWCKLLYKIASASIPYCVAACSSQWTVQGKPGWWLSSATGEDMGRSAVDHHHGEALLHFLLRPWWVLCLCCNPRQREDLNKHGCSHTSPPRIPLLETWYGLHYDLRF